MAKDYVAAPLPFEKPKSDARAAQSSADGLPQISYAGSSGGHSAPFSVVCGSSGAPSAPGSSGAPSVPYKAVSSSSRRSHAASNVVSAHSSGLSSTSRRT